MFEVKYTNTNSESPEIFTVEDSKKQLEQNVIEFECTNSNYGTQVLAFNNDEIDVILRNQNKNIRNYNSDKKEPIRYRITIERIYN